MKILISPAKSLDFDKPLPTKVFSTKPIFHNEAQKINSVLKKKSPKALIELMNISEKLANLNWERNKNFSTKKNNDNVRPAIYSFNGDVYSGLDAFSIPEKKIKDMQSKLRILSGLYGILKPLDKIHPYRLEMGTSIEVGKYKNLYSFWKTKVTDQLISELDKNELMVNLASKEYFGVIDSNLIDTPLISPIFMDFKDGKFKIISFFAKKARGLMARYLIDENASSINHVLNFKKEGYQFSKEQTIDSSKPVFIR